MYLSETHIYDFDKINYPNFIDIIKISKTNNLDIYYKINNIFVTENIKPTINFITYSHKLFSEKQIYTNTTIIDNTRKLYNYYNLITLNNTYNKIKINTKVLDEHLQNSLYNFENITIPFDIYSNLFFYNYYKKIKNNKVCNLHIYSNIFVNLHIVLILICLCINVKSNDKLLEYDLNKIYHESFDIYLEFCNNKYKNILMDYVKLFLCDDYFENNLIYFEKLFINFKENLYMYINHYSKISLGDVNFDDDDNIDTHTIMSCFDINAFILKKKFIGFIDNFKYIEKPTLLQKYLCNLIMETNIQNII